MTSQAIEPNVANGDAFKRALGEERQLNARRINALRCVSVSLFFALHLVLAYGFGLHEWTGNLGIFLGYWVAALLLLVASRRSVRAARAASLAIPFLDVPVVFALQYASLATAVSAGGVAGFAVGVFGLLVILSSLSLDAWQIALSAAAGAVSEVVIQRGAGIGVGGQVAAVILLGL